MTLRNFLVAGELVLIGSQGGINLYVGNNPKSDGKSALAPGFAEAAQVIHDDGEYRDTVELAARALAERAEGRSLTAGEVNRFWVDETVEWVRDQPKQALGLFLRKVVYFWSGYEISNNRDFRDQAQRFTPILRVFLGQFAFLVPFALFGIFPGWAPLAGRRALAGGAPLLLARDRRVLRVRALPAAGRGVDAAVRRGGAARPGRRLPVGAHGSETSRDLVDHPGSALPSRPTRP